MTSFYDYLIIGGGIAGISGAEAIRSKDPYGTIGILSAETHLPYSRVLLPSYLKKKIPREKVFIRTQEHFDRQRIDFLARCAARSVDTAARRVMLAERETGETIGYGKLLIAAGGMARPWPHAVETGRVFRLQTLDDADRLYAALDTIRRPLVIGSSFIALEYIETCVLRGMAPRVLVRNSHLFNGMLDREGGVVLEENMRRHGVSLFYGEEAVSVAEKEGELQIATRHAGLLGADALMVGVGIARNVSFLAGGGIACGDVGVMTDAFLETNVSGVFAAGDITEYYDVPAGRYRIAGNWTHAILQGRRAGLNMAGDRAPFSAVPAYAITNLGMQITAVGECDGMLDTASRSDKGSRRYERFFMRDGALAGAFLINSFADKPLLAELIAHRAVVAPYRDRLRDMAFDIRALSSILKKQ